MSDDLVRVDMMYNTDQYRISVWAGDEGSSGAWAVRTVNYESLAYRNDWFTPLFDAALSARMELEALR